MENYIKKFLSILLAIALVFGSTAIGFFGDGFENLFNVKSKAANIYNKNFIVDGDGANYVNCDRDGNNDFDSYNAKFGVVSASRLKFLSFDSTSSLSAGNVDGDDAITAADARLALRAAVDLETLTPKQFSAADVDKDGLITAADARLILRAAVGLENLVKQITYPEQNEYDVLRKGVYYMKGKMVEDSGASAYMEIAVTQNSVYFLSNMNGADVATLITDKKLYIIYPAKEAYCEIPEVLLKTMGQDMKDIIDTDQLKLFDGPSLNEADSVDYETYNGRQCKVYKFINDDGSESWVYMDGAKLICFAIYAMGKLTSAYDFEFVSATVPPEKSAPPSSYKEYKGIIGAFSFMKLVGDII